MTMVQTAEGALGEVSNLLLGLRQLAVAAANSAVNDYDALTALQNEIRTSLESIDRVTRHTRFGSKPLLDGSRELQVWEIITMSFSWEPVPKLVRLRLRDT